MQKQRNIVNSGRIGRVDVSGRLSYYKYTLIGNRCRVAVFCSQPRVEARGCRAGTGRCAAQRCYVQGIKKTEYHYVAHLITVPYPALPHGAMNGQPLCGKENLCCVSLTSILAPFHSVLSYSYIELTLFYIYLGSRVNLRPDIKII